MLSGLLSMMPGQRLCQSLSFAWTTFPLLIVKLWSCCTLSGPGLMMLGQLSTPNSAATLQAPFAHLPRLSKPKGYRCFLCCCKERSLCLPEEAIMAEEAASASTWLAQSLGRRAMGVQQCPCLCNWDDHFPPLLMGMTILTCDQDMHSVRLDGCPAISDCTGYCIQCGMHCAPDCDGVQLLCRLGLYTKWDALCSRQ